MRELRLGGGKARLGVRRCGVDDGPRREHERHRLDRRVGVPGDPAAHATGVVGDHAAEGRDVFARRVGPELEAAASEHAIGDAEQRPGPHPCTRASIFDLYAGEPSADVDHDPVRLCLTVQARAAATEVHRRARAPRVVEHLADVRRVMGHHDSRRKAAVRARIGCVADQVDRAREHAFAPEQPDQLVAQRLRGPAGEAVRRAICSRRTRRAPDPRGVRCQQRAQRRPQASAMPGATSTCTKRGPSSDSAAASASCSPSRPEMLTDGTP